MKKRTITLGLIGLGFLIIMPVQGLSFPRFHFLVSGQVELDRLGRGNFQKTQAPLKLNSEDLLRSSEPRNTRILCFGHKFSSPISQEEIAVKDVCGSQQRITFKDGTGPETRTPKPTDPNIPYIISPRKTTLLTNRPTLKWNAVAGTTFYEVKLIGPGVDWKIKTDKTSITYSGENDLQPGEAKYTLIVTTDKGISSKKDLSRSDGISFSVLSEDKIKEVKKAVEDLEKKGLTAEMQGLALAYFYQEENLRAEAIKVLEELSKQKTTEPEVYRTLGELYETIFLNSWAKAQYEEAWELIKNQPNQWEKKAVIQEGLGETNWGQGNLEKALEWFQIAQSNYDRSDLEEKSQKVETRMQELNPVN